MQGVSNPMKILIVHNFYREPGGEDECAQSEAQLLEEYGHKVIRFTLHNADLHPGPGSALGSLWSRNSYVALRNLIRHERPDVAHFHNTSHLVSPSGYWAAAADGVPVVQTLHNYRLLCCNALLFREGKPCEDCLGKRFAWPGVVRACYRGSVGASLGVAAVTTLHRALGTWRNRIDVYVAPSKFLRSKFVAAGFPASKIVVKPNFVHPDPGAGPGDGGFALYVGRLSLEKGLGVLLEAWELLGSDFPLKIVGDGPLVERVREAAKRPGVEWLGRLPQHAVLQLMGRAHCLVIPSGCYENFPRVMVEALAKGTPVVASDGGAAAELVIDGVNGFRFRAGDRSDLVVAVRRALAPPALAQAMRSQSRRAYKSSYTGNANHESLMTIYTRAIHAQQDPQPIAAIASLPTGDR
jgi:glycosyltransferase involved in cell wall biosynthesis